MSKVMFLNISILKTERVHVFHLNESWMCELIKVDIQKWWNLNMVNSVNEMGLSDLGCLIQIGTQVSVTTRDVSSSDVLPAVM